MDIPILSNLLRRSRHRTNADSTAWENRANEPRFYASLNEYDPAQMSSLASVASVLSVESASLAALASNAALAAAAKVSSTSAVTTTKTRIAAQAATVGTTRTDSAASLTYAAPTTSSTSTSASSKVTSASSSTLLSSSSSSVSSSATSSLIMTSATPVYTVTSIMAVSSSIVSSSTLNSTSANAASASTTTTGLSTGGIVGVVLAVIFGIVLIGTAIGWAYRKYTSRAYGDAPWSNIPDNDVTPFRSDPKEREPSFEAANDDFYSQPPVIGSRRALALARQNAFNPDGSMRPTSEIMIQRDGNRAGLGAGMGTYSAYPAAQQPVSYGVDAQGRPYNPTAGRTPMPHMMDSYENTVDDLVSISPPSNSRQLLGPGPQVVPVNMGRPGIPEKERDLVQHEAYGDLPELYEDYLYSPTTTVNQHQYTAPASSNAGLPALTPLSPLMGGFMAAQDQSKSNGETRATGNEVHSTPGGYLNNSTSTQATESSFSAHEPSFTNVGMTPVIRLPPQTQSTQGRSLPTPPAQTQTLLPPSPFQHGRPLSPLIEVTTPLTSTTNATRTTGPSLLSQQPLSPIGSDGSNTPSPVPSSNIHEYNPFANLPLPIRPSPAAAPYTPSVGGVAAPPYSATSGVSFPTPRFPPPSPGGMSVPGSVGGSPPRWVGEPRGRALSMYDEDDAYGGI